jgi:hypothetical protein
VEEIMTVLRDVSDVVKVVGDLIAGMRDILGALRDGRAYLKRNHPDATGDLTELLEQMRITVAGLRTAIGVVSYFEFTIDGTDIGREPARFNDMLMQRRSEVADLKADISRLGNSCSKVSALNAALNKRANDKPWWALLGDRAGQRAGELGDQLYRLYGIDVNIIYRISKTLDTSDEVLNAVRGALRAGHGNSVDNVARAAAVLDEHRKILIPAEEKLARLEEDLSDQIRSFAN